MSGFRSQNIYLNHVRHCEVHDFMSPCKLKNDIRSQQIITLKFSVQNIQFEFFFSSSGKTKTYLVKTCREAIVCFSFKEPCK